MRKIDPNLIAFTCSPVHIQSVIEDLLEELRLAEELQNEVLSLNPNCLEIGEGKIRNLQDLAKRLKTLGE